MAISTAVGLERISRIVGYKLTKGNFQNTTPNLPQRVAILGEANAANQTGLDTDGFEFTSAQQVGEKFGYGSPLYNMARILRPVNGGGIGGVPTVVYAQAEAVGAVAAERTITPSGAATSNATHTVIINGRDGVDGGAYNFVVATGDNVAAITSKINDAINAVLSAPVIATGTALNVALLAKWKGLTSEDLVVTIDTNGNDAGIAYAITSTAVGAGEPTITTSLSKFGNDWVTIVVNPYGSSVFGELEAFNGKPDPVTPTGRYQGIVMKPFIALYGDTTEDPTVLTDVAARKEEVTNAVCPAPNSNAFPMEAAANMAVLFARVSQDTPHLDVNALSYADMPVPADGDIGDMSTYDYRDSIVKKGSSTVQLIAGRYQIQDFVTTYHPDGEIPPQFRYCRNLMLDFNVRFGYYLLEQINVVDKAIANDDDVIRVDDVIKPKQWRQIISAYADDLSQRALIADPGFTKDSLEVGISGVNPDRLETAFSYKRTGVARISSTTAQAGFNFGEV